jgi:methylmalonyl-CoA mutase cobalamin-binding subunit
MGEERSPARHDQIEPAVERDMLEMLRSHDAPGLQHALSNLLMRSGLQRFVLDTLAALNRAIGEAWMRGELQIFEEHLYTEQVIAVLRAAINPFPRVQGTPRVLLTTFPGEQHGLGLLMVEALLVPEGANCISLGVQTPLEDIRRAALAHKAQLIALSFSGAFPVRQAGEGLAALRRQLPPNVTLWAGGEMTRRIRRTLPGVVLIPDLPSVIGALKSWRSHAPQAVESYTAAGLR